MHEQVSWLRNQLAAWRDDRSLDCSRFDNLVFDLCYTAIQEGNKYIFSRLPSPINIWLDDVRPAPENYFWVKTIQEAEEVLLFPLSIQKMSLDHDLGTTRTGYDFVKWMAENSLWPKEKPIVHSSNPPGRENMCALINRYFPKV